MFKKLISLICCLLPVGAGAAVVSFDESDWDNALGVGVIDATSTKWQNVMKTDGDSVRVDAGNSINDVLVNATDYGVNFSNGMYVGQSDVPDIDLNPQSNALFVIDGANQNRVFAVDTIRDVSIGTLLNVLNGWTLNIQGVDDASGLKRGQLLVGDANNSAIVHVGSGARLNAINLQSVQVMGPVRIEGALTMSADSIDAGVVNVNSGGVADIKTTQGDLDIKALNIFTGVGRVDVNSVANINVDNTIQNGVGTGLVTIAAGNNIVIGGNLENTGVLSVLDGNISVTGAIKNDGVDSSLSIVADGLCVDGVDSAVSLFNRGNFQAIISGNTIFAKGISVDANAGSDNTFSLTTGTVDFGSNKTLLNSLNSFVLNVNDVDEGFLNVASIENSGNSMSLVVKKDLNASYLSALAGNLSVNAANVVLSGGDVESVQTAINVASGASLDVVASGSVQAVDAVSNRGKTTIRSQTISLNNISNSGSDAELDIGSSTSPVGEITVNGNMTNDAGKFTLYAKNVGVNRLLSVSGQGKTYIIGSDSGQDSMVFGSVSVDDATLGLKVLAGDVDVNGDMSVVNAGVVNLDSSVSRIDVSGVFTLNGTLDIGGSIFALSAADIDIQNGWNFYDAGKTVRFISDDINITGDVSVVNTSNLVFEEVNSGTLDVTGTVGGVDSVGVITVYSDSATFGAMNHAGLLRTYGDSITAKTGDVNVDGIVRFDDVVTYNAGLSVMGDSFLLKTLKGNIVLDDVQIAADKSLTLESADTAILNTLGNFGDLSVVANIANVSGLVQNSGNLSVVGDVISLQNVENNAGANIDLSVGGSVSVAAITNSGMINITDADEKSADGIVNVAGNISNLSGGTLNASFDVFKTKDINITGGRVSLNASGKSDIQPDVRAENVTVAGQLVQGANQGALNLIGVNQFVANNLKVNGGVDIVGGDVAYKLNTVDIVNDLTVFANAEVQYDVSGMFNVQNIVNNGYVAIFADGGIAVKNNVKVNAGELSLDSGSTYLSTNSFEATNGQALLAGVGLNVDDALSVNGVLGQGDSSAKMNILADTYTINAGAFNVGGINQSGKLNINSSDITVSGNIVANDLTFSASPSTNWLNVLVEGNVSGGVDFVGLEKMQITGDYVFSSTSSLMAAILPYANGVSANTADINYWANVNLTDGKLGQITNAPDAMPLITVGGSFTSDLTMDGLGSAENEYLEDSQVGIKIFDMIDQGTAIWLLHADGGVSDISTKIRNINVKFCNEDGTTCVAYFNDFEPDSDGLPAYISVRDSDNDGQTDSLYVVFDERFGGPVAIFPIQPIVARQPLYKDSEYFASGAIDSMIAGQLQANKFYNKTPLEVLPVIFQGTNMELSMNELYNRMEDYVVYYDGNVLSNFSRLFEGTDGEQAAGLMSLNEHTTFRSFEDHMFDEFIWNRNRRLDKAWLDVDYGMFYQNTLRGDHTDGNRFAMFGGFDWQESDTLILGLSGHISHSTSSVGDVFDLSYASVSQMGQLNTRVADTNLGFGGYLMKILGDKARLYGNAFIDAHLFDVERNQTFVDTIDGNGTAFSLISEFGLLHDILNQYIVGNVYARVGYNFGLNISSDATNSEFMKYKQDGYFMLTPGYSVTAQKRIYPTAWLQIRPYATIGVEYDVFGMKDSLEYKFAGAADYSPYDMEVNPLWANIGGGFEVLSANGLQFGLDYRYQYNQEMQLHNIRFSGMYRF